MTQFEKLELANKSIKSKEEDITRARSVIRDLEDFLNTLKDHRVDIELDDSSRYKSGTNLRCVPQDTLKAILIPQIKNLIMEKEEFIIITKAFIHNTKLQFN